MDRSERDSMVIYRSFFEAIRELPKEDQATVWNAVFELGFNFNQVELSGLPKTIFTLIKPQLEANIKKWENGKIKKQNSSKTEAKGKQNSSKTVANVNVNVNDNVNVSVNVDSHNEIFRNLWKSEQWIEGLCMKWKCEKEELLNHLNGFRLDCIHKEEYKVNEKDAKSHFVNWVNKGNPVSSKSNKEVIILSKRTGNRNPI